MKPALVRRVVGGVTARLASLVLLAACGPSTPEPAPPAPADDPPGVVEDTRTEIERRRDVACEQLGPKLTACAIEDARAAHAAGTLTQQELELNTKPAVLRKHTEEFVKACTAKPLSSRQVRVLEVCFREESECAPLTACLAHLNDPSG